MNIVVTGTSQGLGSELAQQLRPRAEMFVAINRSKTSGPHEILANLATKAGAVAAAKELEAKFPKGSARQKARQSS